MSTKNQNSDSQSSRSGQSSNSKDQKNAPSTQKNSAQKEREADPNRKSTQMPTSTSSRNNTTAGKSPIGGSDSLEDYDDSTMENGDDAREQTKSRKSATTQSKSPQMPHRGSDNRGNQHRASR